MEQTLSTESPLTDWISTIATYPDLYVDEAFGDATGPVIPLSTEDAKKVTFVVRCFLIPISGTIGMFGNAFGLHVLRRESIANKNNFYFYMCAVMCENLVLCVNYLLYNFPWIVRRFDTRLGDLIESHVITPTLYLTKIFNLFGSTILIQMSAERLFSLLQPFAYTRFCVVKHPRLISFIAFLIYCVLMLPIALCCKAGVIEAGNETIYTVVEIGTFWPYFMQYFVFYQTVLLSVVMPLVILILNASISVAFYRYSKNTVNKMQTNAKETKRKQQQTKITIVTLTTAISYIVLSTPHLIAFTLDFLSKDYSYFGKYGYIFNFFIELGTFFILVNSVIDCSIYVLVSSKFWPRFTSFCCGSNEGKTELTTGNINVSINVTSESKVAS